MSAVKGFGATKPRQRPLAASKSTDPQQLQQAEQQYARMQSEGLPEFNIYVRDRAKPKLWLFVCSMAVQRSDTIAAAIFQNETALRQGVLRLFPKLAKLRENLEYGYRLKDQLYRDEPIQIAQRPQPSAFQAIFANLKNRLPFFKAKA